MGLISYKVQEEYLQDESGMRGEADGICFPVGAEKLSECMKEIRADAKSAFIQGARTGICGGAVPYGGVIISTARMAGCAKLRFDADKGEAFITVGAGMTLEELNKRVSSRRFDTDGWDEESSAALYAWGKSGLNLFFPPDPTEHSATLGGIAATNASGGHILGYGGVQSHIEELECVLADGRIVTVGSSDCADKLFGDACIKEKPAGRAFDLLIGSEGAFAVITSLTLRLIKKPAITYSLLMPFEDAKNAAIFTDTVMASDSGGSHVKAADFLSGETIKLVNELRDRVPAFQKLVNAGSEYGCAVYMEISGDDDEEVTKFLEHILEILGECSPFAEAAIAVSGESKIDSVKNLRHAATEGCNILDNGTRPGLPRLMIDVKTSLGSFSDALLRADSLIKKSGMKAVIHGHIGSGHLHIRLIGVDAGSNSAAENLLMSLRDEFAGEHLRWAAEYGVGRSRSALFKHFDARRVQELRSVKSTLDPDWILSPGVLMVK
jgi:D-lactate dehydrogenase (cytochrome)